MRKQFILLIYTIFLVIFTANAQYNYYSLPDSMKKDADYIIWEDYREFKVIDEGKAVEHVKFAVLITDQYARRYERKSIGYNKNLKLSGYSGTIYNASGNR
ncbi:MAG: hypothetical protein B6I20_01710 [Bacteroidetes bacterium 4572_117]|nr:MAG: hypothetical protein B6I20_01710 [Bacteroidetes bacterium 4572_117]